MNTYMYTYTCHIMCYPNEKKKQLILDTHRVKLRSFNDQSFLINDNFYSKYIF